LEYFADGPNATFFARAIETVEKLVVPSITLFEVFKRAYQQRGESAALQAVAVMGQGRVVDLDAPLALVAGKLSVEEKLSLADSIVYATAQEYGAILWTQDRDFEGRPNVKYRSTHRS
jgi:predicted nucleic acid-binding protein